MTDSSRKSHLDVDSLNDAGDDMEHLHFCIALCYLLQQLEEQAKYGLQVLERGRQSHNIGPSMPSYSHILPVDQKCTHWEELLRPEFKIINR